MADAPNLPYVVTPGRIPPLLQKIQEAQMPPRFTQDFLETKLGMKGGSAAPLIPLLKRIGFLANDGSPTELYRKYRNTDTSGAALAQGVRTGYSEIFSRNEYAHELSRDKITNMVVEITGKEKDDRVVTAIVGTFWSLKEKADFDKPLGVDAENKRPEESVRLEQTPETPPTVNLPTITKGSGLGLNLAYTVNLNLPESDDINVFNAIFKSLKENLLKG